ncbi:MAG: bifunctional diaminohydroxyphosphoribosylaminopyrimidine deaminase/5-amino-6-(5-phosphoribosylamino)uracil reductase RibD [Gammaproteobacteria bacterium]|nr:bifunctional diaminohydroxyphosphoribosylaminopyrimidine deaminase/5-amino-6-(5-phosphoribosylamino)uracil reductase RibD [Gammaproteobacteria bacterium]MDH5650881.1 bifunctional diaminohydroxyphosphoribosylaminopyrimidine deaminase/5-amino-6-(5-phosphoribosylamino)uracil reductase RibD [Gammaproteobacteria bacterium]
MTDYSANDYDYMARALKLAAKGLYTTHPNPRVGCVLVKAGEIVGEGWHEYAGGPHAEVNALQMAGEQARGATVYLTLEPCAHEGRTPPCANALIKAGVSRVLAAMQDPNPAVAGKGFGLLREAGIDVSIGLLQAEAEALNPGFIKRMRYGRPYVRHKLAMSLDGRTAMASGESKWITSNEARLDVHRLRAQSDAILTGVGTILADDPNLTVRLEGHERQPLRVVVDTNLSLPPEARILSQPGRVVVMTCSESSSARVALEKAGAEIVDIPYCSSQVDLAAVLDQLGELGINEVFVETGATLSGAMLRDRLSDELIIYVAPSLMGDKARGLFRLPELETMDQKIELDILDLRMVGKDIRVTAKVKN